MTSRPNFTLSPLAIRAAGGALAGVAAFAASGVAMLVLGWMLVPITLALRVPASVPDLIAYGSIDVPAEYLVAVKPEAHPAAWTRRAS